MALVTTRELRQLMQIHYIFEIILSLAYVILKSIPWIAIRVFETSEFKSVSCPNNLPLSKPNTSSDIPYFSSPNIQ